jgi:hypothetical protein
VLAQYLASLRPAFLGVGRPASHVCSAATEPTAQVPCTFAQTPILVLLVIPYPHFKRAAQRDFAAQVAASILPPSSPPLSFGGP